jgi:hypothetical protein
MAQDNYLSIMKENSIVGKTGWAVNSVALRF